MSRMPDRARLAGTVFLAALALPAFCRPAAAGEEVSRHRTDNLTSYVFHFGAGEGAGAVTPEMMARYVEEAIVAHFPTGTTVTQGAGQWQNPETGKIVHEQSYVLSLECYPLPDNRAKMRDIAEEYVRRYGVVGASCFVKVFPAVTTELYYPAKVF